MECSCMDHSSYGREPLAQCGYRDNPFVQGSDCVRRESCTLGAPAEEQYTASGLNMHSRLSPVITNDRQDFCVLIQPERGNDGSCATKRKGLIRDARLSGNILGPAHVMDHINRARVCISERHTATELGY